MLRKTVFITCLWIINPLYGQAQEESIPIDSVSYFQDLLHQAFDNETKGLIHLDFGDYYSSVFEHDSAEAQFLKAIEILDEGVHPLLVGKAYYKLSTCYAQKDKVAKALEYQFQSLEYFENAKDTAWMGNALNIIGNSFNYLEENDKALTYYDKAENYYGITKDYVGQAMIFHNKAIILSESGKYKEAIGFYEKSAELFATYSTESDLILTYSNMAMGLRKALSI